MFVVTDDVLINGQKLAGMMDMRKGDAVLDVGCGTGRLTLYLADEVGPMGSVCGIDPSPHRIQIAMEKLKAVPHRNVRLAIGRGEDLSAFRDGEFDRVIYSSVFHWIEDKPRALREAKRVLRQGGLVGMNTIDRDHHFAMRQMMGDLIAKKYPEYRQMEDDLSKMLVSGDGLRRMLEDAGFRDVRVDTLPDKHVYQSVKELFDLMEASSFGNFMRGVPDKVKAAMMDDMGKELEKMRTPEGIVMTAKMLFATATK
jgi:ubiquinone/menaquinone biosynthesis C-methylase UbiE